MRHLRNIRGGEPRAVQNASDVHRKEIGTSALIRFTSMVTGGIGDHF